MAGNVAEPCGGLVAVELLGSAGDGLASGTDCARAEAVYSNPGINTAVTRGEVLMYKLAASPSNWTGKTIFPLK